MTRNDIMPSACNAGMQLGTAIGSRDLVTGSPIILSFIPLATKARHPFITHLPGCLPWETVDNFMGVYTRLV